MMSVYSFLHDECGVCHRCISFMIADGNLNDEITSSKSPATNNSDGYSCSVCFGISSSSYLTKCILPAIEKSLRPYCESIRNADDNRVDKDTTLSNNRSANQVSNYLTRESPTVNLPWLIAVRAHCAIENDTASNLDISFHTAEEVYLRIKEHVRSSLRTSILEMLDTSTLDDNNVKGERGISELDKVDISEQMHKEESGYLGVHIICLPPTTTATNRLLPPSLTHHIQQNMKQLQSNQYRILNPRKRFRGNDPTLKQGGDPRSNLELRVRRDWMRQYGNDDGDERDHKRQRLDSSSGEVVKVNNEVVKVNNEKQHDELSMIIPWLEKSTVLQWIETSTQSGEEIISTELSQYLHQIHNNQKSAQNCQSEQCTTHATTFRRPFYVQGTYTKCRRDISQTPFWVAAPTSSTAEAADVNDDGTSSNMPHSTNMIRKGISSVEEEICPMLTIGCGGISQLNNEHLASRNTVEHINSNEKGAVVYGMCKFHGSGREDMDVRMLLPPPSVVAVNAKAGISITGRPFVCEIFDAHRIPSRRDLELVVKSINCIEQTGRNSEESNGMDTESSDIVLGEKGWPHTKVQPDRYHGNNLNGVGVSSPLSLVPSKAFSSLQSQTESKVKFYGCVCWSSVPISSDKELIQKLGCSSWNEEEGGDDITILIK